jgi:threonine dehydratase
MEKLIRPYVRRMPILAIDDADLGINLLKLSLKLELFQHSGSFKARGAFANLLLRALMSAYDGRAETGRTIVKKCQELVQRT